MKQKHLLKIQLHLLLTIIVIAFCSTPQISGQTVRVKRKRAMSERKSAKKDQSVKPTAEQLSCKNMAANKLKLLDLRLGMSFDDVREKYPATEVKVNKFAQKFVILDVADSKRLTKKPAMALSDYGYVIFVFLDSKLYSISITYFNPIVWSNNQDFIKTVEENLKVSGIWKTRKNRPEEQELQCGNYVLDVEVEEKLKDIFPSASLQYTDSNREKEYINRMYADTPAYPNRVNKRRKP